MDAFGDVRKVKDLSLSVFFFFLFLGRYGSIFKGVRLWSHSHTTLLNSFGFAREIHVLTSDQTNFHPLPHERCGRYDDHGTTS